MGNHQTLRDYLAASYARMAKEQKRELSPIIPDPHRAATGK